MKTTLRYSFYIGFLLLFSFLGQYTPIFAQCSEEGEIDILVSITTGNDGFDTAWELVGLENDTLYGSGSFLNNFTTINESFCVPIGTNLQFSINCCFSGDASFEVLVGDFVVFSGNTQQVSNTYDFVTNYPNPLAVEITDLYLDDLVLRKSHTISGQLLNEGLDTIHRLRLNWQLEDTAPKSVWIENLNLASLDNYTFSHPDLWYASLGNYQLSVWVDSINQDTNPDWMAESRIHNVQVLSTLSEKTVLLEYFTNASCINCAFADPEINLLFEENAPHTATISYHTIFPGLDPMYFQNPEPVDERFDYYNGIGVPSIVLEGNLFDGFPTALGTDAILAIKNDPALFSIQLHETPVFSPTDTSIFIHVNVSPNDPTHELDSLRIYIAIVEQTVVYDQAPGTNGLTDFKQVLRAMHPNPMGQPYEGQDTTLRFYYTPPSYTNIEALQTVVFIQDAASKTVYQSLKGTQNFGTNNTANTLFLGTDWGTLHVDIQQNSCDNTPTGSISIEHFFDDAYPTTVVDYTWSTGETTATINNLEAGTYSLMLLGEFGNTQIFDFQIQKVTTFTATIVSTDASSSTSGDGSASVVLENFEGMTDQMMYEWSDGQTTTVATNLTVGEYQVTVTDILACSQVFTTTIGTVTTVSEIFPNLNLTISPNPSQDKVKIIFSLPHLPTTIKTANLTLHNSQGKILTVYPVIDTSTPSITQNHSFTQTLDLSQYPMGMYFLSLSHPTIQDSTFKIIHLPSN